MEVIFALRVGRELIRSRATQVVCISPALLGALPAILLRSFKGWQVAIVVQDIYGAAMTETRPGSAILSRSVAVLERCLLRRADKVAVIHENFRRYLTGQGIPAERQTVIPNWTHIATSPLDRDTTRRRFGWAPDQIVAVHAGNMGTKQGLETLIDVARHAERKGSPIYVVLIGDGNRRPELQRYAEGAARLRFLPPLRADEFSAALVAADVLVVHEAAGVVEMSVPSKLTSYFAAGRPVVAATSPRSGAADLLHRSGAGLRVDSGDAVGLHDAILAVSADEETANEYGRRGLAFANHELSGKASLGAYANWLGVDRG